MSYNDLQNFPPPKIEFECTVKNRLSNQSFNETILGKINEFEHSTINSEEDYIRYIRESVFRDYCEKAATAEVRAYKKSLILKAIFLCIIFCTVVAGVFIPKETAKVQLSAYSTGYEEGKAAGFAVGKEDGYASGFSEGKEYGYESGKDSGYESGYEEGHYDGYHEGYGDAEYDNIPMTFPNGLPLLPGLDQMIFYSTPWGECYHRKNCPYVTTAMPIRYANAVYAGFSACTYCLP